MARTAKTKTAPAVVSSAVKSEPTADAVTIEGTALDGTTVRETVEGENKAPDMLKNDTQEAMDNIHADAEAMHQIADALASQVDATDADVNRQRSMTIGLTNARLTYTDANIEAALALTGKLKTQWFRNNLRTMSESARVTFNDLDALIAKGKNKSLGKADKAQVQIDRERIDRRVLAYTNMLRRALWSAYYLRKIGAVDVEPEDEGQGTDFSIIDRKGKPRVNTLSGNELEKRGKEQYAKDHPATVASSDADKSEAAGADKSADPSADFQQSVTATLGNLRKIRAADGSMLPRTDMNDTDRKSFDELLAFMLIRAAGDSDGKVDTDYLSELLTELNLVAPKRAAAA